MGIDWVRLCIDGGIECDQLWLSMAINQNDFNPYVLSPSWNVRGNCHGPINIWHGYGYIT